MMLFLQIMNPVTFVRSVLDGEEHWSALIWYVPALAYCLATVWGALWLLGAAKGTM